MKKFLIPIFLGVFAFSYSALTAAPCVKWDQVKSDIQKYFAENKNLKLISLEKTGDAELNTFTTRTGRYTTDKNGNTVEIETQDERCVQKAKVVFTDDANNKKTQTWSVIYLPKNGKLVYTGFTTREEEIEVSKDLDLPADDELKKLIITEWNKNISGDDIELVDIKVINIKLKYFSHAGNTSRWIVTVDMVVVRKGGVFSGNKECNVSGANLVLVKKQKSDPWELSFSSMSFRCDR